MKYKKFVIKNYKGIKDLELDLTIQPDIKIYTLVGLNESGKTTILEAIKDFASQVVEDSRYLLIPKNLAGGFSGKVSIKAFLEISQEDKRKIKSFLNNIVSAKEIIIKDEFYLQRDYLFENSAPNPEASYIWSRFVSLRKRLGGRESYLDDESLGKLWKYVRDSLLPEVIFYTDFLSKFPEKIYLNRSDDNEKYLEIIEDILCSVNKDYSIKTSLLDRLQDPSQANKQALEAVENEIGAKVSKVVFDAWTKIQDINKKEIVVKTEKDEQGFYIRFSVKDGGRSYAISERSLGFRWFFTFLLYTEFRKERIKSSGEILFLLDEPASNLHQTAQKSLLKTFKNIVVKSRLIYTTHSHHLINPEWLNSTYIIRNKGLRYKEDDDFDLKKTEIEAYKYKQFVSHYPNQTSYFQPILDVLDYKPGLLEHVSNLVITEGKFDYFVFKFFQEIIFNNTNAPKNYCFYPGHGVGKLDLPIALYEAWGRKYIVILDSDPAGLKEKKRYIRELSDKEHIFTLEDVDSRFKKMSLEDMFNEEEKLLISREFDSSSKKYEKSAFNTGIQTLYHEARDPKYLSDETKDKFQKLINFIEGKF